MTMLASVKPRLSSPMDIAVTTNMIPTARRISVETRACLVLRLSFSSNEERSRCSTSPIVMPVPPS